MTRENKLALIIGFGLVLVVGILVSDHFSLAYTQNSARLANANDGVTPLANRLNNPALLVPTEEHQPPAPLAVEETPAAGTEETRIGATSPDDAVQPIRDEPVGGNLRVIRGPDLIAMRQGSAGTDTTPHSPGQAPAAGDGFTWHTIEAGETLSKIAARFLGDANRWREIAAINTDRLPDPNTVGKGVLIRIPLRAGTSPTNAAQRPVNTPVPPPAQRAAPTRKHVVAKNENLSEIAQKYLGSARKWREIYDANRDVIKDPDNVLAGTELTIPAR